ncbi:MAG: tetratricopeptide repeat protein [Bacteroidetes bacterium]|nr:tetratricopeptide repeat protein [Bacteroidota bacterium]
MIEDLDKQSVQQQHRHGMIQTLFFKDWLSYRHDPADQAIRKIDSALQHVDGIDRDTALVKFYILKGQCYVKQTQFNKALEAFNQALQIAEKRNDQPTKTNTLVSIGWAYMEDDKPAQAIRFFEEVLRIFPSEDYENRALLLCNIASCYNTLEDYKKAEAYAQKAITSARATQRNTDLANGLNILARSYYNQDQLQKAIATLKEAAVVREKVADPSMLASDYLELSNLYSKTGRLAEAIQWAKKAEAISLASANTLKLLDTYTFLSSAYEQVGNNKDAVFYLKKILSYKDSLADERYNQALARMQVQFETQKKIAENLQLKQENLEKKLRISNQQRWLLALAAGLLLLIASWIYISRLMKSRYNTRLVLAQLSEQKRSALAVMEAEEKERRRISADLHDGVGQLLSAASLQLNKAGKGQLPVGKVQELVDQAYTEVRNLSHQVTPELLLHHGLVKALEQAVARLNDGNEQPVFSLFTHIEEPFTHELASLTLYRCFQELSTNIVKHAGAGRVTVQLTTTSQEIELLVEDDGVGFAAGKETYGLGLKNIENRLALFGGQLHIDSMPGKGATIIIKIQRTALPGKTV